MSELLIGIPTFNNPKRLDYVLSALKDRIQNVDYRILICDDSGKIENQNLTRQVVDKYNNTYHNSIPIKYIYNEKNSGIATSWNHIIRSDDQNSPYIILLNDDIIIVKDSIETMLFFLKNNPNIGAAAYELNGIKEEEIPKILGLGDIIDNSPKISLVAWGAYWGFSREKYNIINQMNLMNYNIVGGFDEYYYIYFEETDFCTALATSGYPNYLLRCPKSWHIGGASVSYIDRSFHSSRSFNHYNEKWKGSHNTVMYNIPRNKVKWMCDRTEYETVPECDTNPTINNSCNQIY